MMDEKKLPHIENAEQFAKWVLAMTPFNMTSRCYEISGVYAEVPRVTWYSSGKWRSYRDHATTTKEIAEAIGTKSGQSPMMMLKKLSPALAKHAEKVRKQRMAKEAAENIARAMAYEYAAMTKAVEDAKKAVEKYGKTSGLCQLDIDTRLRKLDELDLAAIAPPKEAEQ